MRKGQISIFIIISTILLISVLSLLVFTYNKNSNSLNEDINNLDGDSKIIVDRIINSLEYCLERNSIEAIYYVQSRGGYNNASAYKNEIKHWNNIPYYYLDENLTPSTEIFENEIEIYLENNISDCFSELEEESSGEYEIFANFSHVNVNLFNEFESFEYEIPITITLKDQTIITLDYFKIDTFTNFKYKYDLIQKFISFHDNDFTSIPISSLLNLSYQEDFLFNYWFLFNESDEILYEFVFEETNRFRFIINYEMIEEEVEEEL
jgi:hypothetical protein